MLLLSSSARVLKECVSGLSGMICSALEAPHSTEPQYHRGWRERALARLLVAEPRLEPLRNDVARRTHKMPPRSCGGRGAGCHWAERASHWHRRDFGGSGRGIYRNRSPTPSSGGLLLRPLPEQGTPSKKGGKVNTAACLRRSAGSCGGSGSPTRRPLRIGGQLPHCYCTTRRQRRFCRRFWYAGRRRCSRPLGLLLPRLEQCPPSKQRSEVGAPRQTGAVRGRSSSSRAARHSRCSRWRGQASAAEGWPRRSQRFGSCWGRGRE